MHVCIVDVTLRKHRILYFNDPFFVINGLIYSVVHHTKAWFFQRINMNTADNRAFFIIIAFKAGIACFSKIFWEPGFTRFVKNTLFNQTNFSQLVQAWLNPC